MSFFNIANYSKFKLHFACIALILIIFLSGTAGAKDTDIYEISTKQNAYILMDNSGSMDSPVYQSSVDYGAVFDYLFTYKESGSPYNSYIYDEISSPGDLFYQNHREKNKIYLWRGEVGVTTATVDGETVAFTGDAGGYWIDWSWSNIYDTHTLIDASGNLVGDGVGTQRITTDSDGYILLDGDRLPMGRDITLNELVTLYDGTVIDQGFNGLIKAPGHFFSGYEGITAGSLNKAESGDDDIYFFVTGNWINMQQVLNLTYTTNNPDPTGASNGDQVWKYEPVPLDSSQIWSDLGYSLSYPSSGDYINNLGVNDSQQFIIHPGATGIRVHFSAFDVQGDGDTSTYDNDYVALYDADGVLVARYDNDNNPTGGDGWSATVSGDTVKIGLSSNSSQTGTGYQIDKIEVADLSNPYVMQNRMDVAKDAMLYALDEFHGKMNWGYATFQYTGGGSGDGATINSALNPNVNDDVNRAAIRTHVNNTEPGGGTPLGEALQDVFEKGYYGKRNSLDNLSCRKNYIISVTDGYPSNDDEWNRINGVTFEDWDSDGWTADPVQYDDPPDNYYDDVGHWLYTHSWMDKSLVTDPANSYVNVRTHHIAFGSDHLLLKDAAGESGGEYIAAYNKTQLVAAFYAIGLQMTEAIAFTAPVVSVDAANKIQNGDDLYLGLFLPQDNKSWAGNIKKFKLGDGSTDRPKIWMFYDGGNNEAINSSGAFLDNTAAFWGDDSDANDSDSYGAQDVREDGVGEVLTERVQANLVSGNYYERPIYTSISGTITEFHRDYITASNLNVGDDLTRDQIINYVHGYTNAANPTTGAPLAARDWALGAIIHSSPVVIDYYDTSDIEVVEKRFIVVGANDGMLHVFDDADGSEVFAFIPEEILTKLQLLPTNSLVETVDGGITLYRQDVTVGTKTIRQPKYLIFGLRRGGKAYWCLDITNKDPLNWAVKWTYTNSEIVQSWATPKIASIPVALNTGTGEVGFNDIVMFSGGYDPLEDKYPEPFIDEDNSGSPFKSGGSIDNAEWDKNDSDQDINNNDTYDRYNLDKDDYGRGIFAVHIDDPTTTVSITGTQVLPFSVTYGTSNVTTGATRTLTDMKFCFPATPAVISGTYSYAYKSGGNLTEGKKANVLNFAYAIDIYANLYKLDYQFEVEENSGTYALTAKGWDVAKIFSGNPASSSGSGTFSQGSDTTDAGRKTFYPPAVSWGGAGDFFDAGNYGFPATEFSGQYDISALYFGTGDREHPSYNMIRNRLYAVYDDAAVSAETTTGTDITVSTVPYGEDDLMNLSCDELDKATTLSGTFDKEALKEDLTDDAEYDDAGTPTLENGIHENDAKGWYVVLQDQGDTTVCSHCTYPATVENTSTSDRDNHVGEKIVSEVGLYAGILYFTSYQPAISDPCNPQGNGFAYALNYDDGSAAYNLNSTDTVYDVTDRYRKVNTIYGIPSKFAIITRKGQAAAMAMMGGKVEGPKPPGPDGDGFKIKSPGMGLELYYWRESNSQK